MDSTISLPPAAPPKTRKAKHGGVVCEQTKKRARLLERVDSFYNLPTWHYRKLDTEKSLEISDCRNEPDGAGVLYPAQLVKVMDNGYVANQKQERLKPCSGRDEMCQEVLNDEWASHPTWASEDSGFVAHRKNIFEESLHRIEEERHDYDFNIEANAKVISLLEPFAQQILIMTAAERLNFSLPIALGGTSQAIYRRVLKKIYGEKGNEVVEDLFTDPCAVMPIVLARLKAKDEEWRMTQVSSLI